MNKRNLEIRRRRRCGETLRSIAESFGLTRQRVRQIAAGISVKHHMTRWYPARDYNMPYLHTIRNRDGKTIGVVVFVATNPPFKRWPNVAKLKPF